MNSQQCNDKERAVEDLKWLAQKKMAVNEKEECYFCNTIRDAIARGWELLDARYYALGKVMGTHSL